MLRRSPIRRKPTKRPEGNPEHMDRVRRLPCAAKHLGACFGPIHAHHVTYGRGLGQKAKDEDTIPLCSGHHGDFHDARGAFTDMTRERRREWQSAALERTRLMLKGPR